MTQSYPWRPMRDLRALVKLAKLSEEMGNGVSAIGAFIAQGPKPNVDNDYLFVKFAMVWAAMDHVIDELRLDRKPIAALADTKYRELADLYLNI